MQKLAKVKRINKDGKEYDAAVNTALVRHVYSTESGTYIAFDDTHDPKNLVVTPLGVDSPDTIEDVIKRLNQPYLIDVRLRLGAIIVSAIVVFLAIVFSQQA